MTIIINLDTYASEQEAEEIRQAFISLGATDVEVRRDYERKAGADGLLPWTTLILLPITAFLMRLGEKAADRAYPVIEQEIGHKTKQLIQAIHNARNRRYNMETPGSIVIHDTITGRMIIADPGLPDEAYYALSQVDLSLLGPNSVQYDAELRRWVTY